MTLPNVIWSTAQLDRYINEARRQLVMDTGCLRSLQTVYFTQGVESYPFGRHGRVHHRGRLGVRHARPSRSPAAGAVV
jgi:hypothetical protein